MSTINGKVKWFNDKKGFGFITGEDGKDYFVHHSTIIDPSRKHKTLMEGEEVSFEGTETEKGLAAQKVVRR